VVALGTTIVEPEDGTVPTSGLMVTVLAPVTDHVKVEFSASNIDAGLAVNELTVGGLVLIAVLAAVDKLDVSTVTVTAFVTEL